MQCIESIWTSITNWSWILWICLEYLARIKYLTTEDSPLYFIYFREHRIPTKFVTIFMVIMYMLFCNKHSDNKLMKFNEFSNMHNMIQQDMVYLLSLNSIDVAFPQDINRRPTCYRLHNSTWNSSDSFIFFTSWKQRYFWATQRKEY